MCVGTELSKEINELKEKTKDQKYKWNIAKSGIQLLSNQQILPQNKMLNLQRGHQRRKNKSFCSKYLLVDIFLLFSKI